MAVRSTARSPSWLLLAAALPFLFMFVLRPVRSAPTENTENTNAVETYDGSGCYYNYQHYGEGDRIITNEPCLNCTCHNRMLMCYLRVCPFTKAIGQDCTIEKRPDQCCPVITCPEVPVQLLENNVRPSTTSRPVSQHNTAVGHPDSYGCSIDNEFYADGAQVPSEQNKPCELCYCIRNHTACVMQECTLQVEGCKPVYQDGVCCPVRYECEYPDETTTLGSIASLFFTTTTTMSPSTVCHHNGEEYADGALIQVDDKPCEHCYCMRGEIVCAVQECGTPLEREGHNCTALPTQPGKCCPEKYMCDSGIQIVMDTTNRMNRKQYGYMMNDSMPAQPEISSDQEELPHVAQQDGQTSGVALNADEEDKQQEIKTEAPDHVSYVEPKPEMQSDNMVHDGISQQDEVDKEEVTTLPPSLIEPAESEKEQAPVKETESPQQEPIKENEPEHPIDESEIHHEDAGIQHEPVDDSADDHHVSSEEHKPVVDDIAAEHPADSEVQHEPVEDHFDHVDESVQHEPTNAEDEPTHDDAGVHHESEHEVHHEPTDAEHEEPGHDEAESVKEPASSEQEKPTEDAKPVSDESEIHHEPTDAVEPVHKDTEIQKEPAVPQEDHHENVEESQANVTDAPQVDAEVTDKPEEAAVVTDKPQVDAEIHQDQQENEQHSAEEEHSEVVHSDEHKETEVADSTELPAEVSTEIPVKQDQPIEDEVASPDVHHDAPEHDDVEVADFNEKHPVSQDEVEVTTQIPAQSDEHHPVSEDAAANPEVEIVTEAIKEQHETAHDDQANHSEAEIQHEPTHDDESEHHESAIDDSASGDVSGETHDEPAVAVVTDAPVSAEVETHPPMDVSSDDAEHGSSVEDSAQDEPHVTSHYEHQTEQSVEEVAADDHAADDHVTDENVNAAEKPADTVQQLVPETSTELNVEEAVSPTEKPEDKPVQSDDVSSDSNEVHSDDDHVIHGEHPSSEVDDTNQPPAISTDSPVSEDVTEIGSEKEKDENAVQMDNLPVEEVDAPVTQVPVDSVPSSTEKTQEEQQAAGVESTNEQKPDTQEAVTSSHETLQVSEEDHKEVEKPVHDDHPAFDNIEHPISEEVEGDHPVIKDEAPFMDAQPAVTEQKPTEVETEAPLHQEEPAHDSSAESEVHTEGYLEAAQQPEEDSSSKPEEHFVPENEDSHFSIVETMTKPPMHSDSLVHDKVPEMEIEKTTEKQQDVPNKVSDINAIYEEVNKLPSITNLTPNHPAMQDMEEVNHHHYEGEGNDDYGTHDDVLVDSQSAENEKEDEKVADNKPAHDEHIQSSEEVTEAGEEISTEAVSGSQEQAIPGEGDCLVDNKSYRSGEKVPVSNNCQKECECKNSIVHCQLQECPPPPSNDRDCMPVVHEGKCCPSYTCEHEPSYDIVSDHEEQQPITESDVAELTTDSPVHSQSIDAGSKPADFVQDDIEGDVSKPVESDEPAHAELPGQGSHPAQIPLFDQHHPSEGVALDADDENQKDTMVHADHPAQSPQYDIVDATNPEIPEQSTDAPVETTDAPASSDEHQFDAEHDHVPAEHQEAEKEAPVAPVESDAPVTVSSQNEEFIETTSAPEAQYPSEAEVSTEGHVSHDDGSHEQEPHPDVSADDFENKPFEQDVIPVQTDAPIQDIVTDSPASIEVHSDEKEVEKTPEHPEHTPESPVIEKEEVTFKPDEIVDSENKPTKESFEKPADEIHHDAAIEEGEKLPSEIAHEPTDADDSAASAEVSTDKPVESSEVSDAATEKPDVSTAADEIAENPEQGESNASAPEEPEAIVTTTRPEEIEDEPTFIHGSHGQAAGTPLEAGDQTLDEQEGDKHADQAPVNTDGEQQKPVDEEHVQIPSEVEHEPSDLSHEEYPPVEPIPEHKPVESEPIESSHDENKPVESEPVESSHDEHKPVEAVSTDSTAIDAPVESIPVEQEHVDQSIDEHKPTEHIPTEHKPTEDIPVEHKPTENIPEHHAPTEHVPEEHKPTEHAPEEHKPTEDIPEVQKPSEQFHDDHKPTENIPEDHKPTEEIPVDHKPTEHIPVDHKPTETIPDEHKPTEHIPVEHKPTEVIPEEVKPAEHIPAEPIPEEQSHAVEQAAEEKPVEIIPEEQTHDEHVPVEPIPEDKPADHVAEEHEPAEIVHEEQKPVESVPEEHKPAEEQPKPVEHEQRPEEISEAEKPVEQAPEEPHHPESQHEEETEGEEEMYKPGLPPYGEMPGLPYEPSDEMFGSFPDMAAMSGYDDEQASFGPGTCRYGGKVYLSAQQIPRDDPCDFCFCFRSDIICLQQSCPPPIKGCHEEAIDGFCCPRYECPVPMGVVNSTTTTTTTTAAPDLASYIYSRREATGCLYQGDVYKVGDEITSASGPCLECRCGGDNKMRCEPKACSPQPLLRKMIEAVSLRR